MKRGCINDEFNLLGYQQKGVQRILRGYCSDTYVTSPTQNEYQQTKRTKSFLLYDEMGLGKTVQALESQRRMLPHLIQPSLVVGPAGCIHVWKEEAEKHFKGMFDVRLFISHSAICDTLLNMGPNTLVITSYSTLRNAYHSYVSQSLPLGQLSNNELYRFCQVYLPFHQHAQLKTFCSNRSELLKLAKQVRIKFSTSGVLLNTKFRAYKMLVHQLYSVIIMDEAHMMKNAESKTTKAVACILSHYRLALSGTPLMNNGNELLVIMKYALNLFDADWREIYQNPNGLYCRKLRSTVMLGRKKVDIPEIKSLLPIRKKELERVCLKWDMFPDAVKAYVKVKDASLKEYNKVNRIRKLSWETQEEFLARRASTTQSFWSKFQRLRQICLHPCLPLFQVDNNYDIWTGKNIPVNVSFCTYTAFLFPDWVKQACKPLLLCLKRTQPIVYNNRVLRNKLCHEYIQTHCRKICPSAKMLAFYRIYIQTQRHHGKDSPKVVAISHFRTFLEKVLGPWLTEMGVPNVLFAGGSRKKQEQALYDFRNQQDIRVMLIVKRAGAHGLNLQDTASTCVLFDPHFNEALDEQAVQRVDRIGQISEEVIIRKLYMEGSVDEALYTMQDKKMEKNNAWLGRNNSKLSLEVVGLFLSEHDKVGQID
jgi:SNF2 family DNA or RNA helicase